MQHYLYKDCLQVLAEFTGDHGWYKIPNSHVNEISIVNEPGHKIIFYTNLKNIILNKSTNFIVCNNICTYDRYKYICKKGYLTLFKKIENDIKKQNGDMYIWYVCKHAAPGIIKYVIDKEVDLECERGDNARILHYICRYSTLEMLKYIISKGVELEYNTIEDWRPIHVLCYYSTFSAIKYIISKGVNLTSHVTVFNHNIVNYDINKLISLNDRISPADKESLYKYILLKSS